MSTSRHETTPEEMRQLDLIRAAYELDRQSAAAAFEAKLERIDVEYQASQRAVFEPAASAPPSEQGSMAPAVGVFMTIAPDDRDRALADAQAKITQLTAALELAPFLCEAASEPVADTALVILGKMLKALPLERQEVMEYRHINARLALKAANADAPAGE